MKKEEDLLYDDSESVKFIKQALPEEVRNRYDDDDIIYIVDLIYDFYESKGFMDDELNDEEEDDDTQVDFDEDELVAYVQNNAIADGMGKYKTEDIALIVQAELEYCESIGMFE
jgi:hypothetical protein